MRQIAEELSSSKTTIREQLLKHNIPIRNAKESSNNSYRSYGKRRVNGKIIDHKREQQVIKSIIKMHQEGLSNRAISKVLNEMKTPTKIQGKKWHYEMVRTILKREEAYHPVHKKIGTT